MRSFVDIATKTNKISNTEKRRQENLREVTETKLTDSSNIYN